MESTGKTPRRDFVKKTLTGTIAIALATPAAAFLLQSFSDSEKTFAAGPDSPVAHNEKEFRMGVIGPAELSLVTSQIAVDRATQKDAKEFAGFELTEAIAVTGVLKDLNTPVPPMNAKAKATLEKIKSASTGPDFDKAYIKAQLENHEFLRAIAESYLKNGKGKPGAAENQGRHLATLALAVFKEHVALTSRILKELES